MRLWWAYAAVSNGLAKILGDKPKAKTKEVPPFQDTGETSWVQVDYRRISSDPGNVKEYHGVANHTKYNRGMSNSRHEELLSEAHSRILQKDESLYSHYQI